jgi:hypothetical protein
MHNAIQSLNIPSVVDSPDPVDTDAGEWAVPQYGPEWVHAVLSGANVRNGNIVHYGELAMRGLETSTNEETAA